MIPSITFRIANEQTYKFHIFFVQQMRVCVNIYKFNWCVTKWTKRRFAVVECMKNQMDSLILRLMTNVYNCITAKRIKAEQPEKISANFWISVLLISKYIYASLKDKHLFRTEWICIKWMETDWIDTVQLKVMAIWFAYIAKCAMCFAWQFRSWRIVYCQLSLITADNVTITEKKNMFFFSLLFNCIEKCIL